MTKQDCIFCSIINHQIPAAIVAENDDVIAIKDIAPKAPVHILLIPKKHVADVQGLSQEDALAGKLFMMAQQLSNEIVKTKDFRLVINSGNLQHVPHLHLHFLAGSSLSDF